MQNWLELRIKSTQKFTFNFNCEALVSLSFLVDSNAHVLTFINNNKSQYILSISCLLYYRFPLQILSSSKTFWHNLKKSIWG